MPKAITVNYSKKATDENPGFSGAVQFEVPETVAEAVSMWGEDVVVQSATQSVVINVQAICRRVGANAEEAQEAVNKYVPGVTTGRATGGMSQAAISRELKDMRESDPEKYNQIMAILNG